MPPNQRKRQVSTSQDVRFPPNQRKRSHATWERRLGGWAPRRVASAHDHSVRHGVGEGPDWSRHSPQVRLLCRLRSLLVLPDLVLSLGRRRSPSCRIRPIRHQQATEPFFVSCSRIALYLIARCRSRRCSLGCRRLRRSWRNGKALFRHLLLQIGGANIENPPPSSLAEERAHPLAPPHYGGPRDSRRSQLTWLIPLRPGDTDARSRFIEFTARFGDACSPRCSCSDRTPQWSGYRRLELPLGAFDGEDACE